MNPIKYFHKTLKTKTLGISFEFDGSQIDRISPQKVKVNTRKRLFLSTHHHPKHQSARAEETPTPKRRRRRRRRGGGFFVGRRRKRRRKNERVASGPDEDDDDGRRTDDDGDEEDLVGFDDRFVVFIQSPRERGGGVECAWSSSASSPSSSFGTRRIVRRREADKTKRDEPRKVGATAKTTGCEL